MPLSAGEKLGPYEILAPIGEGGMGEVWKARDTRLDRIVAIKVSKTEFSERFEREARAIAALNHSNICQLYDVGPNYLVMEYIEGTPLKGPLPVDQALKYAVQICAALDQAHKKGITHRDLKPANILATKTGIKLLDFGLAKLASAGTGQAPKPDDATLTMALTGRNEIVGTLYYMSPEQLQAQANGQEVDARSDIFSFGLVLHEMLTGKRAFEGSSPASVIAAIMERPAPSIAGVAPPALDQLLQRCLAKDPEDRWQSARDLRAELEWIAADTTRTSSPAATSREHRWKLIAWISTAIAMLAVILLGIIMFGRATHELPVTRLDVVTPPTSDPFAFALSPDGRQLVFAVTAETGTMLWRRPLDQTTAQPLAGTDGASAPFWAPDGRAIGFFADGKLKRLNLDGGLPQVLAAAPDGRGGAWSRDGAIVFTPTTASPLFRVAASGGPALMVTRLDQTHHLSHRWPQMLPDGRVTFFALGIADSEPSGVYVASLDGGPATRLVPAETAAAYAPPGYLLLVDQGILAARSVNLRNGSVGNPIQIAQPVAMDSTIWRGAFSVSSTGVLAHRATTAARRQLVWVDRTGARVGAVGAIDENNQLTPSLSPDGRRVAVQRTAQGAAHIWILDSGRDVATRFRDDPAPDARAVWSPDGSRLAFLTAFQGRQMLIEKPLTGGADDEKRLVSSGQGLSPLDWSADGRLLLYSMSSEKTGWDLWALPLTGDGKAFPVVQTPFNEEFGQISRDGRWIAYQSNESGRVEVYIQPFMGTGGKVAVSTGGGIAPRWRRDGRELFYVAPDGGMMAVPLQASADRRMLEPGVPVKLFRHSIVGGGSISIGGQQEYSVAPDGQRFLINMTIGEAGASPITIVLNWTAALKK